MSMNVSSRIYGILCGPHEIPLGMVNLRVFFKENVRYSV